MDKLKMTDPEVYQAILDETIRQNDNIELIASENFTSRAVLAAQGSVLTNKYAEGYPHARWYGGCEFVDVVEKLAIGRAKELFRAEHVNVQPHSGTQANMAVFFSILDMYDKVLAMDLACGGHLTHGHPHNYSGKFFKTEFYGVSKKDEMIDYKEVEEKAVKFKPKLILAGASAYPRIINFEKFRNIADKVNAYLMVDMAHIAGLVATGEHPSPIEYAHFVTTTTHKTLRGPRGGMILCKKEFAKKIDSEIFPGLQGGPLMQVIAAKAVALKEAGTHEFKVYQHQVVKNAKALAEELAKRGFRIVSGGTDNHLILVDLKSKNISGKDAARLLDMAKITVNKNLIPFDQTSPAITSGIRLGTAAITTRGMKENEMCIIARTIDTVLSNPEDALVTEKMKKVVLKLTKKFPLYPDVVKKIKKGIC